MDLSDLGIYGSRILTLVLLEGLLSADNALVLAVLAHRLPKWQQKKALLFGIYGAFFFRAIGVVVAAWLINAWQFMAVGAAYLLYLGVRHFWGVIRGEDQAPNGEGELDSAAHDAAPTLAHPSGASGPADLALPSAPRRRYDTRFWKTVLAIELTDVAFSVDSIVAAVALVKTPDIPEQHQVWLVYLGGVLGIIAMRLVAGVFLRLLEVFPLLGHAAYVLVAWIGVKLSLDAYAHAMHAPGADGHRPEYMPPLLFWSVMAVVFFGAMLIRPRKQNPSGA